MYAHFGRADDFVALSSAINFTSSVALIRLGRGEDAVSAANAARNAKHFGAEAAILFPDPLDYANLVDDDTALSRSAKVRPGDPDSPYFVDGSALPDIPVVSVSPRLAMRLVVNYTMAKDVPA